MVAFFVAAVIFAVAPWYVFTRVLRDDKPAAGPAVSTAPTPAKTTSPTPTPVGTPGTYEVVTAEKCLNLRVSPGTDQRKVTCLGKGLKVTSDGQLRAVGGMEWLHVTYQSYTGWAAAQYLSKVG
jgi:hypothetical protein